MPYLTEDNAFFYEGEPQPLHRCKVPQKRYTSQLADVLIENFRDIVESTLEEVPCRAEDLKIKRDPSKALDQKLSKSEKGKRSERLLEYSLFKAFREKGALDLKIGSETITHFPSYQIPLASPGLEIGANDHWGALDLIGCTERGFPVVIELKRSKSSESPLRMIVEGLAYAIAIRKMWNASNSNLQNDWRKKIPMVVPCDAPTNLKNIQVVGLAPDEYWEKWMTGKAGFTKLKDSSKTKLWRLIVKASQLGYNIDFVKFNEGGQRTQPSNFEVITRSFCNQTK